MKHKLEPEFVPSNTPPTDPVVEQETYLRSLRSQISEHKDRIAEIEDRLWVGEIRLAKLISGYILEHRKIA